MTAVDAVKPSPKFRERGGGCDRLLRAMLAAHPGAVWSPNDPLNIIAHSRAAELRKDGWDVRCITRPGRVDPLEYGYVLVGDREMIETARATASPRRRVSFADKLLPLDKVVERTGLTSDELYWLHRHHFVHWDAELHGAKQYTTGTVRQLEAIGALRNLGVQLRAAAEHVATRRGAVAADLRRAAAALVGAG